MRGASIATLIVVAAALLVVAQPTPALAAAPAQCAPILPLSQVREGMTGTGHTVRRGTEPVTFAFEVLGVLEDAIAPGRDMILVETSGPVIDEIGGIWFGMSGSPVYVGDRLLGAVAFGFSGSSKVAGVTPAADLLQVLEGGGPASTATMQRSETTARALRQATGSAGQLARLRLPLAVSGLPARGMQRLTDAAERAGLDVIPYAAGRSRSQTGASTGFAPGSNYAVALAAGDITIGGVGTTSYVCDGQAIAFGHPAFFAGDTSMAAFTADALTVIQDPVFGPFKLANLVAPAGTVSQDRLAGVGGPVGPVPRPAPVTSTVIATDTGASRSGRTDVYAPGFIADVAFFHTFANIDSVFDQVGRGTADLAFTISGQRADGSTFRLRRANRTASLFDVAFEGVADLLLYLAVLTGSGVEDVVITSTSVDVDVTARVSQYTITGARVAVDGGPPQPVTANPDSGSFVELPIAPGSTLDIEVDLKPFRGTDSVSRALTLDIPGDAPVGFGSLVIRGGPGGEFDPFLCLFDPAACAGQATSFEDLLRTLEERPRNDDLVAEVHVFPEDGPAPTEPPFGDGIEEPVDGPIVGGEQVIAATRVRLDRPVTGELVVPVAPQFVDGELQRVAGPDRVGTAVALSQLVFPDPGSVTTVVVAGAAATADALVGAPLAASAGGPVLLTPAGGLAAPVAEEIARLGASRALVVGGPRVVSPAVVRALRDAGLGVKRVGGADRFETAALVAARLPGPSVYVVGGGAVVDAAAVSGLAALQRAPILLAAAGTLPAPQSLSGRRTATVVGGTGVVPAALERRLADRGLDVDRLAGATRYETSARIAERSVEAGADPFRLLLATGRGVADALVAGPVAASLGARLLLVDGQDPSGSPAALEVLAALAGRPVSAILVGGPAAISLEVEELLAELLLGGTIPPEEGPPEAG